MTQSGEQLTLKGEFKQDHETLFSFQQEMGISHSIDLKTRNQLEITLYPDDPSSSLSFQMIFVIKGMVIFKKTGTAEACGKIESQQHNLCCICLKDTSMVLSTKEDEIICINLSRNFLNRYLLNHQAWKQFKDVPNHKLPLMLAGINLHISSEIFAILQRLNQTSNNNFCDQLILESKTIELLALQIAQYEHLQNASPSDLLSKENMDKMLSARDILINNTGTQLTLRSLAHLVGTNEFNLKRNFKIAFGSTVYNYLNQYKMEQARIMLQEKDVTVAEVATKMGYKYATHFSSAFKKYFGYLPNMIKSGRLSVLLFSSELIKALEYTKAILLGA